MPSRLVTLFVCVIALCVTAGPASAAPKKAMFRFSATTYSVPENAGTFNVKVVRSGNTTVAASVKIAVDPSSTASSPADYSVTTGTLSFAAGQTTQTVPVTIVDNAVANPNKTVVFKLSNATPAGAQIKTTTSTLTIIDNEGPGTLDFSSNGYTVVESAGLATITVNRIGATNLALSVDYQTQAPPLSDPNPAATLGSDYSAASGTLTFNPGDTSKTFQVPITDDSNAESAEDIGLRLLNPHNLSGGTAPQIGPNSPALLTINDDDVSTFSFASSLFSVNENDASGQATITVNRGGATNIASSVDYATSDGTATAGSDYTATNGTLNFAAGETTKTFTVPVAN